jgi:uncharacterized delta-60 repeat protein
MARLKFPRVAVLASIALSVLLVAPPGLASPGDLDPSFGTGGIVTTGINGFAIAFGVGLAPNGDVVVAGAASNQSGSGEKLAVVEYTSTGKLDHHFGGGDGIATATLGSCTEARGMTIDSLGRIVVVGLRQDCQGHDNAIVVARFRPDGTLDPTFGGGSGKRAFILAGSGERGTGVAMDGDRIVVSGQVQPKGSGSSVFLILRLHDDGTLDHSFSSDGLAFIRFGSLDSGAFSLAVQSNHKVVACGFERTGASDEAFAVARLLSSGSLDTSFSSDGRATVDFSSGLDDCNAVAMDSGRIVLAGVDDITGAGDVALARLGSGGHRDASFGTGGRTTTSLSAGLDTASGVAVDGSGRIIVSAGKNGFGSSRFAVLRYLGNGHLDHSFGTGGIATTKINSHAFPNGLALGNGTVVLAGQTRNGGASEFGLARFKR